MGKKKSKGKNNTTFVPLRHPQTIPAILQEMERKCENKVLEETNNTLNLMTSIYSIVLHEFYDFTEEQLKDALIKVMEQLELCANELVTIDQMMDLCASYGLTVTHTADQMDKYGTLMLHKTKAYELLDNGVTEVEDIAKQGNMTSRLASAFRWQWNKEKFGKDYEGDEIMKTKKELAYALFDKGIVDPKTVAKEIDVTRSSVDTYKHHWKKEILEMLSTEEAAPYFAGEKELWELKAEKLSKINENKKTYVAPSKEEKSEEKEDDIVEEVKDSSVQSEVTDEIRTDEQVIEITKGKRSGLKKMVVYESELPSIFQYRIKGNELYLGIEEVPSTIGGNTILSKEQVIILAQELLDLAEEM